MLRKWEGYFSASPSQNSRVSQTNIMSLFLNHWTLSSLTVYIKRRLWSAMLRNRRGKVLHFFLQVSLSLVITKQCNGQNYYKNINWEIFWSTLGNMKYSLLGYSANSCCLISLLKPIIIWILYFLSYSWRAKCAAIS